MADRPSSLSIIVTDVIKLAGRGGAFDLEKEFGIPADRVAAFDRVASLAIAAGIDALRDAGIPLVMRYKTTSKNTQLPDRWGLPDALRDDTAVIFASVFPGSTPTRRSYRTITRIAPAASSWLCSKACATTCQWHEWPVPCLAQEIERRMDELRARHRKEAVCL